MASPEVILMNLATILFLLSSFPQMVKSYRRRKIGLKDFNILSWIICCGGVTVMAVVGFLIGAWITVIIETWHIFYHVATLWWIMKYRREKYCEL